MNFSTIIKTDLVNALLAITLSAKFKEEDDYTIDLFKGNLDFCDFEKSAVGRFALRWLRFKLGADLKDYTNFDFKCPIKKGLYYLKDLTVPATVFLPRFLLVDHGFFRVTAIGKAKVKGSRAFARIASIKVTGGISKY